MVSWILLSDLAIAAGDAGGEEAHRAWDTAITGCREALESAAARSAAPADRASLLLKLAACLRRHPRPDWDGATACFERALDLCRMPGQSTDRGLILYMFASCLHDRPQPDWDRALAAAREALDCFRATGDSEGLRGGLYQLGWILQARPEPRVLEAATAYRELVGLARASGEREELERALTRLAAALDSLPEPDLEGSISAWREAAETCVSPNARLALVATLDAAGRFAEADDEARALAPADLPVESPDPAVSAPACRRRAWLALRRNDLAEALAWTACVHWGPEAARARLVEAIVRLARGEEPLARAAVESLGPAGADEMDDLGWGRKVAAAFFRRHAPAVARAGLAFFDALGEARLAR
ncbi:MAG: hypothetical protein HYZ53_04070 [Planctomycetes bacterium]|nr:hypothetical protein [Planctomycetota bacterium]